MCMCVCWGWLGKEKYPQGPAGLGKGPGLSQSLIGRCDDYGPSRTQNRGMRNLSAIEHHVDLTERVGGC